MLRKDTHIQKTVLIIIACLFWVNAITSIYVVYLASVLGVQLIIPAVVLTISSIVCAVLYVFAQRKYRSDEKHINESESCKIAAVQENIRISQAMKAWILTMGTFSDKYPDVKEAVESFEKVIRDVDVPGDVYGVMEKLALIGHKVRKASRHKNGHKGA